MRRSRKSHRAWDAPASRIPWDTAPAVLRSLDAAAHWRPGAEWCGSRSWSVAQLWETVTEEKQIDRRANSDDADAQRGLQGVVPGKQHEQQNDQYETTTTSYR